MAQRPFTASDGVRLHWRMWAGGARPRAALLLLHGVGEYADRYDGLARRLASGGVSCFAFDHRGHGRSTGHRVHVERWDRYEADVDEFTTEVVRAATGLPLFIYGHSMGSLICITLAIRRWGAAFDGFEGWVISGASIRPTGVGKPWMVAVARLLSRVAPRFSLDLGIAGASVSHDPAVVAAYDQDPRIERRATVRWGTEALGAVATAKRASHEIDEPILILHGGADPLSEADGSRWLAEQTTGETQLIIYQDALHEPHNDPEYADVPADIERWIGRRLA